MATIFVPKEVTPGETRVAATPDTVERLLKDGHTVLIQSGAGTAASFTDEAYKKAGARVESDAGKAIGSADVVLKINPPDKNDSIGKHEIDAMKEGAVLVSFVWHHQNPDLVDKAVKAGISLFSLDQLPRTLSRAQKIDALSSQANLAGYKAVLMAADRLPRIFPMMMTPSGKITPARVVIFGAGVAGLQAVATAKRLGAVVEVTDVRPETKEQVESLGGRFLWVEGAAAGEGGYAAEQSDEFKKKQAELVRSHVVNADVVITTALIPGRKAPVLVTEDVIKEMKPGSVIVDIATGSGGNVQGSEKDKVVTKHGVTIVGYSNVPGEVPYHSSAMFAKNVLNVVLDLYPKGESKPIDFSDEVNAMCVLTHGGKKREQKVEEKPAEAAKPKEEEIKAGEAKPAEASAVEKPADEQADDKPADGDKQDESAADKASESTEEKK